ncbi:MAG TPA: diphthine synthase [Candidatus Thermoplasmatota archaeon]|nr:diphthine synthase [Candidatus Thermoplasmatota archaeon]
MGLTFIGLGLHDARDISLKGLEACRAAQELFFETYTSRMGGAGLEQLEALYGKPITPVTRQDVEDGTRILDAAKRGDVCFLAVGDSMAATTHVELRVRAAKLGIATRVIHGASVLVAVSGLLGLQSYKFGRSTTLAFPHGNYLAESPYDHLVRNLQHGLHTLVLLDLDAERGRYMTATEGLQLLLEIGKRRADATMRPETLVCVVARAGSDAPLLRAGALGDLLREDFGPPLHSIVVPGELHFLEEEALKVLAGLDRAQGVARPHDR